MLFNFLMMIYFNMKRIVFFLSLIFAAIISSGPALAQCNNFCSTLVFDDKTNQILFEKRADAIIYPASLTKMMTAYLVFEALEDGHLSLSQHLTISANAQDVGNVNKINTLKLKEGEQITVEEALKGMLVKSFNEDATALAEAVAGDEWHFAQLMNQKAKKLKMNNTNFRNASGLHEEGHYTTSYDLARLVNALEKDFLQYRKYFSLKEFSYNGTKYLNTNHLLVDYKGVDGFKTGFTSAAGFNLVASAKRDVARVNVIVTGCESYQKRDEYVKILLDEGFKEIERKNSEAIVVLK